MTFFLFSRNKTKKSAVNDGVANSKMARVNAEASPLRRLNRLPRLSLSNSGPQDVNHGMEPTANYETAIDPSPGLEGVPDAPKVPSKTKTVPVSDSLCSQDPVVRKAVQAAIEHGEFEPLLDAGQKERPSVSRKRAVAAAIRELTKSSENKVNRSRVAVADGVDFLVSLLSSSDVETVEHAVTAILNLSLTECVRGYFFCSPSSILSIVDVLTTGNMTSKANAAAALFSLSDTSARKVAICQSESLKPLLTLLQTGNLRGKKDAALALFSLSLHGSCRKEMVQAGVVDTLVQLLRTPELGIEEKVVATINALSYGREGRMALLKAQAVSPLLKTARNGSVRAVESAVSSLLTMATRSEDILDVLRQSSPELTLDPLSIKGSTEVKSKALKLLELLNMSKSGTSSEMSEGHHL